MNFEITESIAEISASSLPLEDKEELIGIAKGERIPSLTSDVIVKKILSPEEHPDRLDYILQRVMQDADIKTMHSAANEGQFQNRYSKKVISDIPVWLKDHRLADLEIQVAAQDYIFNRTDIYSSNMLMIQYSAEKGQSKKDLDYSNVNGAIIVVLMKKSPKIFRDFNSKRYIHRIKRAYADSGMIFEMLRQIVFVQLDKALAEFVNDTFKEDEDYELLKLLATFADPNNEKVKETVSSELMLKEICDEAFAFSQSKEVQAMLLAEKMAIADWDANRTAGREEMNSFYAWLHDQHRDDDIFKALSDATYRCSLFNEYISSKKES